MKLIEKSMRANSYDSDLMTRVAWLSFVGDLSQKQIASRLGISRIKVNRLIARAIKYKLVRFSIEQVPASCVLLEDELADAFNLQSCLVAPVVNDEDPPLAPLATAGSFVLQKQFSDKQHKIIGVGHGRTLEAAVEALPYKSHKQLRFVSVLGCLSRLGTADPLDVIHHLSKITEAECYYLPAPLFAESEKDKHLLMQQKLTRKILKMGMKADFYVVGVGGMGKESYFYEKITAADHAALVKAGAVGDVLGQFLNAEGDIIECDINHRAVAVELDALRDKRVLAIAGGRDKNVAITAALRSGVITDLVIDESTAAKAMQIVRGQPATHTQCA